MNRPQSLRPRLAALGLGVASLLACIGLLGWVFLSPPRGAAFLGVPEDAASASDKSLGINTDLRSLNVAQRDQAMAAMQAAGLKWLRQRFAWDAIELTPGSNDWATWDEIVTAADQHGLALIAVLDGSPRWARAAADAENPLAPPLDARDFGSFASALAARYGDRIDFYQIWDEPNIAPHWGDRQVDPEGYARLLREAAIQIRAVDPVATILAAALAPNVEPGGANMSELQYLEALYESRADLWFDVVAAQLYDFGEPLDASPRADRLDWARAALLRDVMVAYGDSSAAVWAVSFGWNSRASDAVRSAVAQARADWPWLGPMLWAAWLPQDSHGQFAVTDWQGQTTELILPLAELAAERRVAWPGVYYADHSSGDYQGDWRVTPLGADIGQTGDLLRIRFRGTRIDLGVSRGDYRAFLYVEVDGQPANELPRDSDGRAYAVLYDPLWEPGSVTLARGLADGEHVAEIVAERGWGQWAITGWTVSREGEKPVLSWPLLLGLSSLVLLGIALMALRQEHRVYLAGMDQLLSRYRALDARISLLLTAGVAVLVYITEGTSASLASLCLLGLLLALRPETGVPLVSFALPFYQLGKPLLGKVFSMVEILVLLTALAWAIDVLLHRLSRSAHRARGGWGLTSLDTGVLAILLLAGASLLWAEHGREAARELRTVVFEATIFYGLVRVMVRDRDGVWLTVDAWVLGGSAIALIGIIQWVSGSNLIAAEGVWRVRGFYGSPNNLALYLGRLFPLVVAVAAWGRRDARKPLYGSAALVMGAALVLTYSRGAWLLGVPASLLFLALVRVRRAERARRAVFSLASVLILVVVLLAVLVGTGRLASLPDASGGTSFLRLKLWQSSLAMVKDHPLLGVGLDNFLYQYRTHYVQPTAWEEFDLSHPHNLVLDFWLRLGLLGPILLCLLLVAFFRSVLSALGSTLNGDREPLVLGLAGGVVSFVAHGLVDNAFFLVDLAFCFMLALSLVQVSDVPFGASGRRDA